MKTKDLQEYSEGFKRRAAIEGARRKERIKVAWEECRRVVQRLREQPDIERIVLFGSLARDEFESTSDLDFAVYGLSLQTYQKAYAEIEEKSGGIPIDLIRAEDMSSGFKKIIEESGVILYDRAGKKGSRIKTS